MTPEQALKLLDEAVSQVNTNRAVHSTLIQALEVLRKLIDSKKI